MAKAKNTVIDITKEDFEKLHARLKSLDNGWAETLVEMVNKEIGSDPVKYAGMTNCDKIKVYNVFNGVVRNTKWKTLVYSQGLEFIQAKESEVQSLLNRAKEIV